MKVYQLVVCEDPGRGFVAACTVQVMGTTLRSLPLADARGVGSGVDAIEAAGDAITAATLGLPEEGTLVMRQTAREDHYD